MKYSQPLPAAIHPNRRRIQIARSCLVLTAGLWSGNDSASVVGLTARANKIAPNP
jgi:hypothetical protein